MNRLIALSIGVLALVSCSKPEPPTLKPERATVVAMDPQKVELRLDMQAMNPNAVDLSVRSVSAHVVVDGKYDLGTTNIEKPFTLTAKKATRLEVPIAAKWADLTSLVALGASNRAIPYTVDGRVSLGGDLVNVTLPFSMTGTVSHDEIVRATIQSLPSLVH